MMTGLTNALKGIGGEFELNRVVGAVGGIIYIIGAQVFVAWNMANGKEFDLIGYCAAFPGGLAVIVGSIAGAVAWKDKGVASAKIIEQTGAIPTKPPAGPSVPTGDPPPVDNSGGLS